MISFNPSEEQRQIIDMVGRFAADVVRPNAHDCEEGKNIPDDQLAKFWELGLIANSIPEDCGGTPRASWLLPGVARREVGPGLQDQRHL